MANGDNEKKSVTQEDAWSGAEQGEERKSNRSFDYVKNMTEQRDDKGHKVSEGRQSEHNLGNYRTENESAAEDKDSGRQDGSWYHRTREAAGEDNDAVKRRRTDYARDNDNDYSDSNRYGGRDAYGGERREDGRPRSSYSRGYRRRDERNDGYYPRENDGYRSHRGDTRDYEYGRYDSDHRRGWGNQGEQRRPPVRVDPTEPNQTIGIFGLNYHTTEEELREHVGERLGCEFERKYSLRLIMNRLSGRSKGFGFLTFDDIEDAIKAKGILEGGSLNGFAYRVAYSCQQTDSSMNQQRRSGFSGNGSGNYVSEPDSKDDGNRSQGQGNEYRKDESVECGKEGSAAEVEDDEGGDILEKTEGKASEEPEASDEKTSEKQNQEEAQSEAVSEAPNKKGGAGRRKKAGRSDSQ